MNSPSRERTRSLGRWLAACAATVLFGAAGAASAQTLGTVAGDLTGSSGLVGDVGGTVTNLLTNVENIATTALGGKVATTAGASAPAAINKYTGQIIPNGAVLLVWTGDGCSTPLCDPSTSQDFLAVIDAEPNSTTYGNVINTAELTNLLASDVAGNELGVLGSDSHNDPHHMLSYTSYISGGGDGLTKGHKYTFAGGVISKNVFRFDITSVRNIQKADVAVCGTQPRRSSLTDDFLVMPAPGANHKIMYTYMSNYVYGPGGTITEIDPDRTAPSLLGLCVASVPAVVPLLETVEVGGLSGCLGGVDVADDNALLGHKGITEYSACVRANQARNPTEYTSYPDTRLSRSFNEGVFYFGNKDVGIEALPHGMALTYDGKYLVSSDYAVAASIGAAAINGALRGLCNQEPLTANGASIPAGPLGICGSTYGSSVRVWPTSNSYTYGKTKDSLAGTSTDYSTNPYIRSVSAVPDGPRHEEVIFHEENEGTMGFAIPHQSHHTAGQRGWVNLGDPSYDKAVTTAGVAAQFNTNVGVASSTKGSADYVPHDGAFTPSMCGGTLFYTPDITLDGNTTNVFGGKGPYWRAVYDVGPCTGVGYLNLTDDDRFLILPISGIESPASIDVDGAAEFDRDYPREHSRRVLTLDVRPLLAKGHADTLATAIACDFPPPDATRTANTTLGLPATRPDLSGGKFNILKHNNEADDCPRVRGAIGQFETGPLGTGLATTESSNTSEPGIGYFRLGQTIQEAESGTLGNVFLDGAQTGGEPSGTTGGGPGSGNLNSVQNFYTHGGPHFTVFDRIGYQPTPTGQGGYLDLRPLDDGSGLGVPRDAVVGQSPAQGIERYVFIQYFVELNHVGLPGTGNDGDRTICLGKIDRASGATVLDTSFTDEILGTPCLDFDSAARDTWLWPGARGEKGTAKPHSAIFERDGAALFGPGYYPAAPLNLSTQ